MTDQEIADHAKSAARTILDAARDELYEASQAKEQFARSADPLKRLDLNVAAALSEAKAGAYIAAARTVLGEFHLDWTQTLDEIAPTNVREFVLANS